MFTREVYRPPSDAPYWVVRRRQAARLLTRRPPILIDGVAPVDGTATGNIHNVEKIQATAQVDSSASAATINRIRTISGTATLDAVATGDLSVISGSAFFYVDGFVTGSPNVVTRLGATASATAGTNAQLSHPPMTGHASVDGSLTGDATHIVPYTSTLLGVASIQPASIRYVSIFSPFLLMDSRAGEKPPRVVITTAAADGNLRDRIYHEVRKIHAHAVVDCDATGNLILSVPKQPAPVDATMTGILIKVTQNQRDIDLTTFVHLTHMRVVEKMSTVLEIISDGRLFPPDGATLMRIVLDDEESSTPVRTFNRTFVARL